MVYTLVLEASAARIESSSLSLGTMFARFVYRFRTLAFHVSKTGSIPVPSTIFKGEQDVVSLFLNDQIRLASCN